MIEQVCNQEGTNLSNGDMHNLMKKCRTALSQWKSKTSTNSTKQINQLKQDIQKAYEAPSIDCSLFTNYKAQLQLQYMLEEELWRTKSRVIWLQAADKNTKYFHFKTKQRRNYNRIVHIQDDHGKIHKEAKGHSSPY